MKFTIPGNPVAQGRPRFFRYGARVGTYDPQKSVNFKQKVAIFAKEAKIPYLLTPLQIDAKFYFPRPKCHMRSKDPEEAIYCPKRPDADNLIKACLDALNGIAYKDDGQVVLVVASKWYHEKNGQPRTEIDIQEVASCESPIGKLNASDSTTTRSKPPNARAS